MSLANPNHPHWVNPEKPTDAEKLRSYNAFFGYTRTMSAVTRYTSITWSNEPCAGETFGPNGFPERCKDARVFELSTPTVKNFTFANTTSNVIGTSGHLFVKQFETFGPYDSKANPD